jgi:gas vesicle protein
VSSEDRDRNDAIVSLLAGIGVGVLLGTVAALLLAPQSGSETRTRIRDTADDALGRLRDSMEQLRAKVEEVASQTRDAVSSRLGSDAEGAGDDGSGLGEGSAVPDAV